MEKRLKALVEANSQASRAGWALKWKGDGGMVVGMLCSYVPEEIFIAAGLLPWRITGTWRSSTPRALAYRQSKSRLFGNHVLESLLSNEFSFLDGVIATDREQELVRVWDVWAQLGKTRFCYITHIPRQDSELAIQKFAQDLRSLSAAIEQEYKVEIGADALRTAISVMNDTRHLLARVYELRKSETPPLSGAEVLGIVSASMVMPKDYFIREIKALLPYLDSRPCPLRTAKPRVMVSSDLLDNPGYLSAVEDAGCIVAMDDIDPGSRYCWDDVDTESSDPFYALAKRYIGRPSHPRMSFWDKHADRVIRWAGEYRIDGVIELPEVNDYLSGFHTPYLLSRLRKAGIPAASYGREYHLGNIGQLSTRIAAFTETLPCRE